MSQDLIFTIAETIQIIGLLILRILSKKDHEKTISKVDHVILLTNSKFSAAIERIAELEKQLKENGR